MNPIEERLDRIEKQGAVIETKLDTLIGKDVDKEDRIRKLEKQQWIGYGILTALVALKDQIVDFFTN